MIRVYRSPKLTVTWFSPKDFEISTLSDLVPWICSSAHDEQSYWWSLAGFQISLAKEDPLVKEHWSDDGFCTCEECQDDDY